MSHGNQAVWFNAVPLLVLGALYLAVAASIVPQFWRQRRGASIPDWANLLLLPGIGIPAVIFGAQVLLVGTLPVDLARGGTAAAAAGFVNFMGYMGAAAGDKLTGNMVEVHGWQFAVRFWAACAFASAVFVACLWNVGKKRIEG